MKSPRFITLHVQADAPPKPPEGQTCNGCGVCCLAEPCPMGVLLTGRLRGACRMLRWDERSRSYRCGVLQATDPEAHAPGPGGLRRRLMAWVNRRARRWISAGTGCDCSLEVGPGD